MISRIVCSFQALVFICQVITLNAYADGKNYTRYSNDPFTKPGKVTPLTLPDTWPTNFHRNPHDLSSDDGATMLLMLGTGTPNANPYRLGPSFALVVNDYPYLVDAGEGIWRAISKSALINGDKVSQALSPEKLKYLFITHLHEDHTVGIPSILLSPFKFNIPTSKEIYGPVGTKDMVSHIVSAWTVDIEEQIHDGYDPEGGKAVGHDIHFSEYGTVYEDHNVKVEAFRTIHGSLKDSYAYRFTSEDRVVVFTGDGGPYNENIVKAAMGADILVTESATEDNIEHAPWGGSTVDEKKNEIFRFHFSPSVLARIANEAKVKAIVLTHEQNYGSADEYQSDGLKNEIIAAGYNGVIYSAMDGDIY